jgi:hypothetical protein
MTWTELLDMFENLETAFERRPRETSNTAHYTRIDLMNALARARQALEALAHDETNERTDQ